jgi:hypothetical protein
MEDVDYPIAKISTKMAYTGNKSTVGFGGYNTPNDKTYEDTWLFYASFNEWFSE